MAPILARALTMPSHIFFPDTDMLLVMVRHIEEMQPRGEGNRKRVRVHHQTSASTSSESADGSETKGRGRRRR